MKKTLVVIAHPDMEESRLNKTLLDAVRDLPNVTIDNLYVKYPDFSIAIKAEQQLVIEHDYIVLQFPLYWYQCPSLMKKWFDDILMFGFAYGDDGDKLKDKKLYVAITAGSYVKPTASDVYNSFELEDIIKPFRQIAEFCQMEFAGTFLIEGSRNISDEDLAKKAQEYRALLKGFK